MHAWQNHQPKDSGFFGGTVAQDDGLESHEKQEEKIAEFLSQFYAISLGKEYPSWPKAVLWWKMLS